MGRARQDHGAEVKGFLRSLGAIVLGILAILMWANYFLGPFLVHRPRLDNEFSAQEVSPTDGFVSCSAYRDWYLTSASGPCQKFVAPPKIAVGEHFQTNGTDYEIRIILATHIEADFDSFKRGDWYCEAAESEGDLDYRGNHWRRTWLLVPRCKPLR